jgi:hypothetical protein
MMMVSTMNAQWGSDPSKNTLLAGVDTTYAYGEMAGNKNDSCSYLLYYKSYLPNPPYFHLYMQKIDLHGYKKWGNDGVLISQGPNNKWISGVALVPNQDSCTFVAYSKIIFYPGPQDSVNKIFINKVTKSGKKLWGEEGIQVGETTEYSSYGPVLLCTADNQVCIGYEDNDTEQTPIGLLSDLKLKKFSASGALVWQYTLPRDTAQFNAGIILKLMQGGNIMAIYKHLRVGYSDTTFNQSIFVQKFDAAGTPLFPQPKDVLTYAKYKYDPPMTPVKVESNMQDGFYIGVSFSPETTEIQTFIQQIDASANTIFPQPVEVATPSGEEIDRTDFDMRYLQDSHELLVIWVERNFSYHNEMILGQKISSSGQRVWADTGKIFYPLTAMLDSAYAFITLRKSGTNESVLFYMKKINNDNEDVFSLANKYGPDGNTLWAKPVLLSNRQGNNKGLNSIEEIGGQWVAYYTDFMDSTYAVRAKFQFYAQNLYPDGRIGLGVTEYANHTIPVKVYPNPSSDNLTIEFEKPFGTGVKLILNTMQGQPLHCWDFTAGISGSNAVTISLNDFPAGLYLLNIQTPNGSAMVKVVTLQ